MTQPIIVWFRRDLRIVDHAALSAAADTGQPIVSLFVLDEDEPLGGAARWWLHYSLEEFAEDLGDLGLDLILRRGSAREVVPALAKEIGAEAVFWSRLYEPATIARDKDIKQSLRGAEIEARSFPGWLLLEPWQIETQAGEPYKVFTPFWKAVAEIGEFGAPLPAPSLSAAAKKAPKIESEKLADWALTPTEPDWAGGLRDTWSPGEQQARATLTDFLEERAGAYKECRDLPAKVGTSRLSPHLHWGEVSPRSVWVAALEEERHQSDATKGSTAFRRELVWREFCQHLLFHWPVLLDEPWKPEFADFPWADNEDNLKAWADGRTGYPIVDAGMRELWVTGWMHNRVRMIVASFLTKDLLVHWLRGAEIFEDRLVDADLANNRAGWQWVAGSGADAAPYFRIFNPVTQGEKFDPDGCYVRRYLPELAGLDTKYIHKPWEAPASALKEAGVELGSTYPKPMVDHSRARDKALSAYERIKKKAG